MEQPLTNLSLPSQVLPLMAAAIWQKGKGASKALGRGAVRTHVPLFLSLSKEMSGATTPVTLPLKWFDRLIYEKRCLVNRLIPRGYFREFGPASMGAGVGCAGW